MSPFRCACGLLVFFVLLPAATAEEEKILDRTKDEWLKILATNEKPRLRKAAALALGLHGPGKKDVLPALIKALGSDKDEEVRLQVITVLGQLEPSTLRDALPTLADALKDDKSAAVRTGSARLLGRLEEYAKPAVGTLRAALKDQDANVRGAVCEAIGKIGPDAKDAITEMLPLLKDPDPVVRGWAAFAYGRIGPDAAFVIPDLLQSLEKDMADSVRIEAARSIGRVGSASSKLVMPAIVRQLQVEKSDEVRRELALAFAKLEDAKAIDIELFAVMKNEKDAKVRLHIARAIPMVASLKDYVKDYAEWLRREPDSEVRFALVQELGALGPDAKDALDALSQAESDVVLQVRQAAKEAVAAIKTIPKKKK